MGDRAGNTALIFAIAAPVLILFAGGVTDLIGAFLRQTQLQQAVDAAATSAVSRHSGGYLYAVNTMKSDGPIPDSVTQPNLQAMFSANWRQPKDSSTPKVSGTSCGGSTFVCRQTTALNVVSVNASVSASATFSTYFLGMIGMKTLNLHATSQVSDNIPTYMNFYMLLDNSPSMGIAATTAGINTMVTHTPDQCAFACHDTTNSNNYYNLAQSLGVSTRIANVAQAAANLLSTAQSTENTDGIPNEFSVGVFDFGASSSDPTASGYMPVSQVYPSQFGTTSSNLSAAATAAAAIDLMTVQGQGQYNDEDTGLNTALNFAAQYLTTSGNGASSTSPEPVLFLVSDGIVDTYNCAYSNGASCRQISPIDPTPCNTLKSHGVKIAVLYTTYLPLPTNSFWTSWVQPYSNPVSPYTNPVSPYTTASPPTQIGLNMQTCASPGLFFEVNSSQDINAAMNALFSAVVASVRITG